MVGERGSTNLEILRTGSGKICRRWLKGVGEMKEICVVSKRGIGMKKKFEFILKFQRVSFFLVYIWKFETLEDWKMIKKKCINSTIWKIWKVLRKLKKLQKERNLKILRISTSSPIVTRNNASTPIESNLKNLKLSSRKKDGGKKKLPLEIRWNPGRFLSFLYIFLKIWDFGRW